MFPGLQNVFREDDPDADTLRQPVDFYSPDTFNYVTLDISADGNTLSVNSYGINSYQPNTFPEPEQVGPLRHILGFEINTSSVPDNCSIWFKNKACGRKHFLDLSINRTPARS